MDSSIFLELTLISAQDLQPLAAGRRLDSYATVSATFPGCEEAIPKLRTRVDREGSTNPTWNDKFLFRLPAAALSSASITVDLIAGGGWCFPDSPLGSVRLLLSNHRLIEHPKDVPLFAAAGVRRQSGRYQGILNVGFIVLSRVSKRAAVALESSLAVSYRDLMGLNSVLKEVNREMKVINLGENKQQEQQLCGLGMRIHSSSSDENLQFSWVEADDDAKKKKKKRWVLSLILSLHFCVFVVNWYFQLVDSLIGLFDDLMEYWITGVWGFLIDLLITAGDGRSFCTVIFIRDVSGEQSKLKFLLYFIH